MLRVCTTLLYALTADAVGSNLKVERASAIEQVMNTVSSLLGRENADDTVMNNLHALASQSDTPGAVDSLNTALASVITLIEENVESKIRDAHTQAQAAVDKTIDELKSATADALAQKAEANGNDNSWFDCVAVEKTKREIIEQAEQNLQQSETNQVQPCQHFVQDGTGGPAPAESFNLEPKLNVFECDVSQGECVAKLEEYEANEVQQLLASVHSELVAKKEVYTADRAACDAALADVLAKQNALTDALAGWKGQKAACVPLKESRQLSMCLFGTDLQSKCEKAADHEAQVALIDGAGSEFSKSDRVAEWKTTVKTKCLLQKIIDGEQLDAAATAECDESVNYDRDVGEINRHEDVFAIEMTSAKFTCSEKSISFRGQAWHVPHDEAPASSAYTDHTYTPEVSLVAGTPPFAACAV